LPAALFVLGLLGAGHARASPYRDAPALAGLAPSADVIQGCLRAAARAHHVPLAVLVMLLEVEGGKSGEVTPNTNGTVDIGPFQVNEIWLPAVAAHWHMDVPATFLVLRDNFCGNAEEAAWILRQAIADAHGDVWDGVGRYHSANPSLQRVYLWKVLAIGRSLLTAARNG
jgi:hypothetical protein